jgi:hypothetical protein
MAIDREHQDHRRKTILELLAERRPERCHPNHKPLNGQEITRFTACLSGRLKLNPRLNPR